MLIAKNITKAFAGVSALSGINLELHPGKVNAIIGENGAGKSTLVKILSGVHTRYGGDIILNGRVVKFRDTKAAEEAGIAIIHQELQLVPGLSIAENIFLGREPLNRFGLIDQRQMNAQTALLLETLNLQVSPDTKIAALKIGQQQVVEIAKALNKQAAVIIMDEPTSAISQAEAVQLFAIMRQLTAQGTTIVYISHKLDELFSMADRYCVLRDGKSIEQGNMAEISHDTLILKMTGRQLSLQKRNPAGSHVTPLLQVKQLGLQHPWLKNQRLISDISFTLHYGEILGIYGLMGAGRTELMECLFGLHPNNASGEISVNGRVCGIRSPADAIAAGLALVPEDRKLHGLILNQSIKSNISLTVLSLLEKWGLLISAKKETALTSGYISTLGIKTGSENNNAKELSGGNQQKIVLAKWLATHPKILLLDEPTRGIDINAKAEIYDLMKTLAGKGMGIIMVSSELPEMFAVPDRVLVMCEGVLTASIPIEEATETGILKFAIQKNDLSV